MARDLRRNLLEIRCLVANPVCSGVLRSAPQSLRHVGDGVATVTPSSFEVKADIRGYTDVARGRQPLEPDLEGASASGQVGAPTTDAPMLAQAPGHARPGPLDLLLNARCGPRTSVRTRRSFRPSGGPWRDERGPRRWPGLGRRASAPLQRHSRPAAWHCGRLPDCAP